MEKSRKYDKMGRGSKGHSEGRNPAQTTPGEEEEAGVWGASGGPQAPG